MRKSLSQLEATQAVVVDLHSRLTDLERQRDAALELAKELRHQKAHTYEGIHLTLQLRGLASETADLYRGFDNGCVYVADRIEAIFVPKEGK